MHRWLAVVCFGFVGCASAAEPAVVVATSMPAAAQPVATSTPTAARAPASSPTMDVERVADGKYVVRRAYLEALAERWERETEHIRVVPEKLGDRVLGLRVFGIREGTPFAELGLENGDRISKLGEEPLVDGTRVLEIFTRALSSPPVSLELERHGVPLKLVYDVR